MHMHGKPKRMLLQHALLLAAATLCGVSGGRLATTVPSASLTAEDEGVYTDFPDNDPENVPPLPNSLFSPAVAPVIEILKKSLSPSFRPINPDDPFDIFRDDYPLPPGYSAPLKEYDFVVVGAGSAGSVVASRLSEGGRWSVLLLEAGGAEGLLTDVPMFLANFQKSSHDWGYRLQPQGICLGLDDQRCGWPRGKVIGGSSSINYMIYTRGHRRDYDNIADAGNPGWSYDEVLPYFLKSEKADLQGLEYSAHHNTQGLLSVEFTHYRTPLMEAFLDAGVEIGGEIAKDHNQGDKLRFSRIQTNTQNGRRHSAARAFLFPFRNRPNLHILPYSRVTKVNIDPATKTAKSVEYVRNKLKYTVKARKEIILSAGVVNSPQILMLSGVGPKDHLIEHGIPVIQDLQVGQTMYDHVGFLGLAFLLNTTGVDINANSLTVDTTNEWIKYGEGPLSSIGTAEALGHIKTNASNDEGDYPDAQVIMFATGLSSDSDATLRKGAGISDAIYDAVYKSTEGLPSYTMIPMLLHPKSTGYMKLKNKNPFHFPKLYYDYFANMQDVETMIEAIKYTIRLAETSPLQKYGSVLNNTPFPNCLNHTFGSDSYWDCAIRTLSITFHNQIGSCKMGPASDPGAVVDNKLRVHGIKKLRVADASIIPLPLAAHTNAPSIMVGEKLADLVKKTWRQ